MTTTTMTMKNGNGLGKITGPVLLILTIVIAIPFMGKASVAAAVRVPEIQVEENPHADKHLEAEPIRQCLDKNGATQIWRNKKEKFRFYALCQLGDGRWGFREFVWNTALNSWWEVTAFVPKGDGSWNTLIEYVGRSASRFKGPFPWQ
jgi:hypothetical protein